MRAALTGSSAIRWTLPRCSSPRGSRGKVERHSADTARSGRSRTATRIRHRLLQPPHDRRLGARLGANARLLGPDSLTHELGGAWSCCGSAGEGFHDTAAAVNAMRELLVTPTAAAKRSDNARGHEAPRSGPSGSRGCHAGEHLIQAGRAGEPVSIADVCERLADQRGGVPRTSTF